MCNQSFCKKDAFQSTGFTRLKCQLKRKKIDTACFQRFFKFQPTRKWVNKVNLLSFSTQNLFQIRACVISARKAKHLEVTTLFTYPLANTPLGQSERAYYLSYFRIEGGLQILSSPYIYSISLLVFLATSVQDSSAGNFCTDSITSAKQFGIDCHTGAAYSRTGLILVRNTFRMRALLTPALPSTLREHNFLQD